MFTESGSFVIGCNYWASHAGTAMWSDWRPDVVDEDLRKLAAAGLQVLRVFPLWPDFQPITLLRGYAGEPSEIRHGEMPLPDDAAGQAGVSAVAADRLAEFLAIARRHDLKVVLGLITGWMSGRMFVPPALEGRKLTADPEVIQWQLRLVRYLIGRFKDDAAIAAWDLGNECNCLGGSAAEGAAWTATLANAIRAADPTRPVVSGMHSFAADPDATGRWTIAAQAEWTDVLCVHPYPLFTPHCDLDPLNTMRSCLHAAAEARFYGDIGGKPCLGEEVGTLGNMIGSEQVAADYIRTVLFSLWAHDARGLLWWCAHDQGHLAHAPYDWCAVERELGFLRQDGSPKPVLGELTRFRAMLESLPFPALPARRTDAVCILSHGQDQWGAAFASFILAKQAGFDIEFQYETQPLKPASLYLLPAVSGLRVMLRRRWKELQERVRAGAALYISHNDGILSDFEDVTGLRVRTRSRRTDTPEGVFEGLGGALSLPVAGPIRLDIEATRARVLAREPDGNPVMAEATLGKGHVVFVSFPVELRVASTPGAFAPEAPAYWRIYRQVAAEALAHRAVAKTAPVLGVTEHDLAPDRRVVVVINYSPAPVRAEVSGQNGWAFSKTLHGQARLSAAAAVLDLPANDAVVLELERGTQSWENTR
jgi:hypothetical protein